MAFITLITFYDFYSPHDCYVFSMPAIQDLWLFHTFTPCTTFIMVIYFASTTFVTFTTFVTVTTFGELMYTLKCSLVSFEHVKLLLGYSCSSFFHFHSVFLALSRRHSLFWLLLASVLCSWLPLLVIHHSWFLLVVIPYVWSLLVFISCFHSLVLLASYVDSLFLVPSCCFLDCFGFKSKNSSLKFLTAHTAARCSYAVNLGKFHSLTRGPSCKEPGIRNNG